jgi:hypothetical protein
VPPSPITRRQGIALSGAALATGCATPGGTGGPADAFSLESISADLDFLDKGQALHTGAAGDLALAERVAQRLRGAGFSVDLQPIEAPGFRLRKATVAAGSVQVPVVPQAIVTPTGPAGLEAPLRLWQDASDTPRMKDAIAVVMLPYARHSQLRAPLIRSRLDQVIAGAPRAVILVTVGPTGQTIWLNAPFEAPYAPIPIATLGPAPGAPIIEAAQRGDAGRLVIDGDVVRLASSNVFGRITGRGPILVVSTPRTGWTRAVAERGPGLATFLALAAWAPRALPRNDLLFVTTCAHEYDNAGGIRFINTLAPKPADTHLWVHLGAGFAARAWHEAGTELRPLPSADEQRFLVGAEDLLPTLRDSFAGLPGLESPYPASAGAAGELGEILRHGYTRAFGVYGGHAYHHVDSDGINCTDPRLVLQAALAFRSAIMRLAPP